MELEAQAAALEALRRDIDAAEARREAEQQATFARCALPGSHASGLIWFTPHLLIWRQRHFVKKLRLSCHLRPFTELDCAESLKYNSSVHAAESTTMSPMQRVTHVMQPRGAGGSVEGRRGAL